MPLAPCWSVLPFVGHESFHIHLELPHLSCPCLTKSCHVFLSVHLVHWETTVAARFLSHGCLPSMLFLPHTPSYPGGPSACQLPPLQTCPRRPVTRCILRWSVTPQALPHYSLIVFKKSNPSLLKLLLVYMRRPMSPAWSEMTSAITPARMG